MKTKAITRNQMLNEELIEHHLTHNLTNDERHFLGEVDFFSPSRAMIQKESSSSDAAMAIREDAENCANILRLIFIAQKVSSSGGVARANCCAGLRVYAAFSYYLDGKTYEVIAGELGGKKRQIPKRYVSRFLTWSSRHCEDLSHRISPDEVMNQCRLLVSPEMSLSDVMDELRISLVEMMHELKAQVLSNGLNGVETYSDITEFDFLHKFSNL